MRKQNRSVRFNTNRPQAEMTASPTKYPQGFFKDKACRWCGTVFKPQAPSHLYCSQSCADAGVADKYYRRTYGIGLREYEKMFEEQKGLCAICLTEGFDMMDPEKGMIVVDHCHDTGKIRGLLCHNCNRGIGLLQDDPENLKRALEYLEGATTIPKGSTPKRAEAPSPGNG